MMQEPRDEDDNMSGMAGGEAAGLVPIFRLGMFRCSKLSSSRTLRLVDTQRQIWIDLGWSHSCDPLTNIRLPNPPTMCSSLSAVEELPPPEDIELDPEATVCTVCVDN